MRRKVNEERYEALRASVAAGTLAQEYPPTSSNTLGAFADAFWRSQNAEVKRPWLEEDFVVMDVNPLLAEFSSWPDVDKWQFINHWCDDFGNFTWENLLPKIKDTSQIGQSGVLSLIAKEIEFAERYAEPVDESMIALWIKTYTGRINLLPDLSKVFREIFPKSKAIDEALAGLVTRYVGGHDSFNHIARDSDFFCAVDYPKTFGVYLQHFSKANLTVDAIELFFRDAFISEKGVKPSYLEEFRSTLGDEAVKELFATNIIYQRDCSGEGPVQSFKLALSVFGEDALLATPQFQQHLAEIEGDKPEIDLLKWISEQYLDVHEAAPRLYELCILKMPALMTRYRFTPATPTLQAGVSLLGGEGFIRHYLSSLRQAFNQDVGGVRDWRVFDLELKAAGLDIQAMTDFDLVDYAYATQKQFNAPTSTSIRNVCYCAGIEETAKVAGDMSIKAAENLLTAVSHQDRHLVIKHFPNSQVLALETDLGL